MKWRQFSNGRIAGIDHSPHVRFLISLVFMN